MESLDKVNIYKVYTNVLKGVRTLVPYNNNFYIDIFNKLEQKKDLAYESIYFYSQSQFDEFKIKKSLAGITNVCTDKIVFDFDSKENIELALIDTREVVRRLQKDNFLEDEIQIYFSSGKGFHVVLELNNKIDRKQFELIVNSYASDLKTFDTTVKDEQRLFRVPLSYNFNTNKYKFPIPIETFNDNNTKLQDILEYAKSPSLKDARDLFDSYKKVDNKFKIKKVEDSKNVDLNLFSEQNEKPDFTKNKTGLTNAKYALSQGYFGAGERHEATMILAATYMGLGWHQELAYNNIKATLRLRNARQGLADLTKEGKKELWQEVKSVFSINWKGGMYSDDKNPLLLKTKKTYNIEEKYDNNITVNISEVDNIFLDFATNIDKNTIKLGIKSFDDNIRITTSTLNMLLAPPGVGKSNISFGILNHTSLAGIKSMFFSLDMATPQVYQRLVQRHNNFRPDEIFNIYKNNQKLKIEQIKISVDENYKNVKFCFKGAMSIDKIRETLLTEKNKTGVFPKLVIIDYLENITTDFSDSSQSKAFAARSLKDIANEFEICVILLVQPRLSGGDGATELNSYTDIKGSSVLGETATTVITAYRPGFNPKDNSNDNFLSLTVVKNRMGQLGRFDYHWDGLTGQIRELLKEEQQELEVLLKMKAEQNKNEL